MVINSGSGRLLVHHSARLLTVRFRRAMPDVRKPIGRVECRLLAADVDIVPVTARRKHYDADSRQLFNSVTESIINVIAPKLALINYNY